MEYLYYEVSDIRSGIQLFASLDRISAYRTLGQVLETKDLGVVIVRMTVEKPRKSRPRSLEEDKSSE